MDKLHLKRYYTPNQKLAKKKKRKKREKEKKERKNKKKKKKKKWEKKRKTEKILTKIVILKVLYWKEIAQPFLPSKFYGRDM